MDSELIYLKSLKKYLETCGIIETIDNLVPVIGTDIIAISQFIKDKYKLDETIEEIIIKQRNIFDKDFEMTNIETMPHLPKLLNNLKLNNIKIGLVSSSRKFYLNNNLNRLGIVDYFDCVIAKEDVKNSKPNSEGYLKAVNLFGLKTNEVIVFEDSYNGILSAKNAEIKTIAYKGSTVIQDTKLADYEIFSYLGIDFKYLCKIIEKNL